MEQPEHIGFNLTKTEVAPKRDIFQQFLDNADFDTKEASVFMWGGKREYDIIMKAGQILLNDPIITDVPFRTDMERGEAFRCGFRRLRRLIDLEKEGKVPKLNWKSYGVFTYALGGLVQSSLHHGMFESTIKNIGTDEQIK